MAIRCNFILRSHNYITMTKTKLIARDGLAWWQSIF